MIDYRDELEWPPVPPERRLFCNRTLNLRNIKAIGYDMDYTLIHYRVEEWERRAYRYIKRRLSEEGWPVDGLEFDPELVIRGLIVDTELGNVVKANRFGYVKQAFHGTKPMAWEDQREVYSRNPVHLSDSRYTFLNTLFSLSEGCIYLQLVDLLDAHKIKEDAVMGYADLWRSVRRATDLAHMEGKLKADITSDPDQFVDLDPDLPETLLEQKDAGKTLLLITNSGWNYSNAMMSYAFDRFLPEGLTWRNLFDVIIVSSRKPDFFFNRNPIFEVVDETGMLRPAPHGIRGGGLYLGGNAMQVEEALGVSGDEILYVGDHIYSDAVVSKRHLRWRTALVLRELEAELQAVAGYAADQHTLDAMMQEKERMEFVFSQLRRQQQNQRAPRHKGQLERDPGMGKKINWIREQLVALDDRIRPLAQAAAGLNNPNWGLLMRAGNDKSHLARQVERYADIYLSRVSNFRFETPFVYLRSPRGSLPHDPNHLLLDPEAV